MQVKQVAGALGALISGVDLRDDLGAERVARIRRALLDHQVIFFRDQTLSAAQYLRFARLMGEPVEYPFVKGLPDFPEIIQVTKLEHERTNFGGIWHSDTAYLDHPPMGSMLLAREVPPFGGDTLFANQVLAFESLSPGMQRLLDGLVAINSSSKADVSKTREDRIGESGREDARKEYVAEHPVVRTHPETGR
ncbi:MAG: TauD/TfdA family dioxygenase, partial [Burkholderiaceae bacterium]|nr:TauD/TfdA family dioxygenase [Burkholderiaceae bacterium]